MSTNFLSLPSELRNKVYKQLVVLQEPVDPWDHVYELAPELRVNKMIHREACPVILIRLLPQLGLSMGDRKGPLR
jgi:hypothetical protein